VNGCTPPSWRGAKRAASINAATACKHFWRLLALVAFASALNAQSEPVSRPAIHLSDPPAISTFLSSLAVESAVTIRTAHDSAAELATKAQLERLIAAHDLRQWTFTHEIVIDEKSIPHSHPVLTLHTRHLKQDDELLSTYLHEQLHWFLTRMQPKPKPRSRI
jgi:hypothetical protein